MITRYKDKSGDPHDPGDESDWNHADSALVDAIDWARNGMPRWKVELLQNLARQLHGDRK